MLDFAYVYAEIASIVFCCRHVTTVTFFSNLQIMLTSCISYLVFLGSCIIDITLCSICSKHISLSLFRLYLLAPVNGEWGNWHAWNTCTTTCGCGLQNRLRDCNHRSPRNDGNYCDGVSMETHVCNSVRCTGKCLFIQNGF